MTLYNDIYSEFRRIGIHIFRRKLTNSRISGLFIKHPLAGKCILVNYSDDIYRQNFTIAHEVAHALLDNNIEYNLSFIKEAADYREYRANAFASSFLVPEEALKTSNEIEWTDALIIKTANRLKVNIQTLLIALSNYKKISDSEYNRFRKLKIPVEMKEDFELANLTPKRIMEKKQITEKGLSDDYIRKCHLAYTNGNISAGKLAEMLLVRDSELPELLDIFNLKLHYDN
nr:ImmA/IrrE family metallo-endopeptidase [uncultured Bacteroides sp.]